MTESETENWEMDLPGHLKQVESYYLQKYYEHYGNIRDAAAALNMDRSTFARKRTAYLKGM